MLALANIAYANDITLTAMPDSIDPEDEEAQERHEVLNPKNTATEINGLDYVMESRYRPQGKAFGRKWYDHIFLEGATGLEQVNMVSGWGYWPMATLRGSIGKQFHPWHTVRLAIDGGAALQRGTKKVFYKVGGRADYLFNISSYLNGYDPTRPFEVQAMLGAGIHYSKIKGIKKVFTPEAYAGLQFKIYAGPFANINIEPYIGITPDRYDFSGNRNWRNYDLFYGAQVSFTHYLTDNVRYAAKFDPDSLRMLRLSSETPWFLEAGMGMNMMSTHEQSFGKTMGHEVQMSLGKWMSPFFALRGTLFGRSSNIETSETEATTDMAAHTLDKHSTYWGARGELMINPFGFNGTKPWTQQNGLAILLGAEVGWLKMAYTEKIRRSKTLGADFGVHLWHRISNNLQVFVEPRYTLYVNNNEWKGNRMVKHINYHSGLSIDAGITMLLRKAEYLTDANGQRLHPDYSRRIVAGVMGGLPMVMNYGGVYQEGRNLNYDVEAFGEYKFDGYHGLRLSLGRMALSRPSLCKYYGVLVSGKELVASNHEGLWNRQFNIGRAMLDYTLSLTHLMSKTKGHAVETNFFVGAGVAWLMSQDNDIYSKEPAALNGEVTVLTTPEYEMPARFALNGGLSFEFHVSPRFSILAVPELMFIHKLNLPGFSQPKALNFRMIESLKLGIQYEF